MEQLTMDNLFSAILREDVDALLGLFSGGEARLNMPSFGLVSNNRIFAMLVKKIANRFRYLNVSAHHLNTQRGDNFLVAEYVLGYLFYDEERGKNIAYDTPTALLCELDGNGKIAMMNVYTGFDAFVGRDVIRPAMYNARNELWNVMPAAVREAYEQDDQGRYEPCHVFSAGNRFFVEENALFTKGEICTPQAHLSAFVLGEDGSVERRYNYGAIVWEFKLWPTLY